MDPDALPPRAAFELRNSLNPPTLVVPANDTQPEHTVHATGHPLNWQVAHIEGMVIELNEFLFNWRVTLAYQHTPMLLEGGWCYFGLTWNSFCTAVRGAASFIPSTHDGPADHGKAVLPWTGPKPSGRPL